MAIGAIIGFGLGFASAYGKAEQEKERTRFQLDQQETNLYRNLENTAISYDRTLSDLEESEVSTIFDTQSNFTASGVSRTHGSAKSILFQNQSEYDQKQARTIEDRDRTNKYLNEDLSTLNKQQKKNNDRNSLVEGVIGGLESLF